MKQYQTPDLCVIETETLDILCLSVEDGGGKPLEVGFDSLFIEVG